ncbi:hypothetical protein CPB86DRAFT_128435 [Serendipita vermifera]|nr:hypothetical protein CPB86DRAFT_128435 [Serendipita vermifera]
MKLLSLAVFILAPLLVASQTPTICGGYGWDGRTVCSKGYKCSTVAPHLAICIATSPTVTRDTVTATSVTRTVG